MNGKSVFDLLGRAVRLVSKIRRLLVGKKSPFLVQSVLILYSHTQEEVVRVGDFDAAISYLKEDYNFVWMNQVYKKVTNEELSRFDFVLVVDHLGGVIDRHLRSLKKINILKGILITNSNTNYENIGIKFYDVVWFKTYAAGDLLPKHRNKIHAFGIVLDAPIKRSHSLIVTEESEMLRARVRGFDFSFDMTVKSLMELSKSPIWDFRYYGNQIRYGIESLSGSGVKATQLIKSSIKLKAGRSSFYNRDFFISGDEYVEIGSFCSLGKNISIITSNHDVNYPSTQGYIYRKYFKQKHPGESQLVASRSRTKGPVVIRNDVWVGDGVKIMSGVTIGNGACIGAGSIVTKNVGDYEIVGGAPAKHIKMRFYEQDIIDFLLQLEWWNWSDKKIINNEAFFLANLNEVNVLELKEIIK